MTACYLDAEQAEKDVFCFQPQETGYGLILPSIFAEILCPNTIYGLIDYHLRECLKRFAGILAGRIARDKFYGWSERARGKAA